MDTTKYSTLPTRLGLTAKRTKSPLCALRLPPVILSKALMSCPTCFLASA